MHIDFPLGLEICQSSADAAQRLKGATGSERVVVLTGQTFSRAYCEELLDEARISPVALKEVDISSIDAVYGLERSLRSTRLDRILAIGGGRVADFAKRLAYVSNLPLMLVPTIIANDGLISPIAVLNEGSGGSVSLPGKMPDSVIIDLSVIRKAPRKFLVAAACDIVTNISATNDWKRVANSEHARGNHLALQLARMAAFSVLDCRSWDIESPEFIRSIVSGQILSGVAMALAGSSRPCSGSEHLISHALDHMHFGMDVLHGEKVGIASRYCLYLQGSYTSAIDNFFRHFNVSKILPGCAANDREDMCALFEAARCMRPDRGTILDEYSNVELAISYEAFVSDKFVVTQ